MTKLLLTAFRAQAGRLTHQDKKLILTCEEEKQARIVFQGDLKLFEGKNFLYIDVYSKKAEYASPVFNFEFWQENDFHQEPDLTIRKTCLPQVLTRIIIPFTALDAQKIFLPRTHGTFRGFVTGKAVELSQIIQFSIGLREYWSNQEVEIYEIGLTEKIPPVEEKSLPLMDEFGQWNQRDWAGKTHSLEEMQERLQKQLSEAENPTVLKDRSIYGGWTKLKFNKTGFFHTAEKDGRHYLVDPDGYAFFSVGLNETGPRILCPIEPMKSFLTWIPEREKFPDAWVDFRNEEMIDFLKVNFRKVFGEDWEKHWKTIISSLLSKWGINSLGNFSQMAEQTNPDIPYVFQLENFPATATKIYRDFPDVFSEEYRENSRIYAKQLEEKLDDRYLIGYFMRNEPQWGFAENLEIAAELLSHSDKNLVSKQVFVEDLKKKYGTIEALNLAWNVDFGNFEQLFSPVKIPKLTTDEAKEDLDAFSYKMIREYVRVPAMELKKVDANHLNLGMRYAFILYPNQCAGKEYLDVFSINCYKVDPSEVLKKTTDIVQMPVLIGEFHFGSIDKGLGSTGIIGVKTQEDRGKAYQLYLEACAENSFCVGAHWYTLYDQSCMGRFDGENYQIGFLDICNNPYEEFIARVIHTHERLYPLIAGEIEAEKPKPQTAKSNIAS